MERCQVTVLFDETGIISWPSRVIHSGRPLHVPQLEMASDVERPSLAWKGGERKKNQPNNKSGH